MKRKPNTDSDNEVATTSKMSKKSNAEISKLVANLTKSDGDPVDPFLCVLEADSRHNLTSVSTVISTLSSGSISAMETPSSFAISPTTDTQTQKKKKKHRYTDTQAPQSAVLQTSSSVFNYTEAMKADMVAFKDGLLKEIKEQAALEMVTFKNAIVGEVKQQIAAEFAKFNFPHFFKTMVDKTALIQSKLDVLGRDSVPLLNQVAPNIPQDQRPPRPNLFNTILTIDDLIALNERAKNPEYVAEFVDQMSIHYGKDACIKKGRSAAMKLIDKTVDRDVFKECCWTGKGRGREKLKFGDLQAFMHMFYCAVRYSDPTFTTGENESFLRSCLANSGVRADNDPVIQQSQRKRVSKAIASTSGGPEVVRVFIDEEAQHSTEGQAIEIIYVSNAGDDMDNGNIQTEI